MTDEAHRNLTEAVWVLRAAVTVTGNLVRVYAELGQLSTEEAEELKGLLLTARTAIRDLQEAVEP